MRTKQTWTFAIAAALAVAAAPSQAGAAEPPKTEAQMTRQELRERDQKLFSEFQAKRRAAAKNGGMQAAQGFLAQESVLSGKPREIEVRVEEYIDGAILYSVPVDKKTEPVLLSSNRFRRVNDKKEINDRVIYNDRVYRIIRASTSTRDWKDAVGHDAMLTIQTKGGATQAMSVRVKK